MGRGLGHHRRDGGRGLDGIAPAVGHRSLPGGGAAGRCESDPVRRPQGRALGGARPVAGRPRGAAEGGGGQGGGTVASDHCVRFGGEGPADRILRTARALAFRPFRPPPGGRPTAAKATAMSDGYTTWHSNLRGHGRSRQNLIYVGLQVPGALENGQLVGVVHEIGCQTSPRGASLRTGRIFTRVAGRLGEIQQGRTDAEAVREKGR